MVSTRKTTLDSRSELPEGDRVVTGLKYYTETQSSRRLGDRVPLLQLQPSLRASGEPVGDANSGAIGQARATGSAQRTEGLPESSTGLRSNSTQAHGPPDSACRLQDGEASGSPAPAKQPVICTDSAFQTPAPKLPAPGLQAEAQSSGRAAALEEVPTALSTAHPFCLPKVTVTVGPAASRRMKRQRKSGLLDTGGASLPHILTGKLRQRPVLARPSAGYDHTSTAASTNSSAGLSQVATLIRND